VTGPISRAEPLVEQVYKYLKGEILASRLEPGEKIVETRLAEQLHTSRSPVREAIQLLLAEQLLIVDSGSVCVFYPSYQDFRDLYELRLAVEPQAARLATERLKKADLSYLKDNLSATERCVVEDRIDDLLELNALFHRRIWAAAGNTRFTKVLEGVAELTRYYWNLVLTITRHQTNIVDEHHAIVAAFVAGNAEEAQFAMYKHIGSDLRVMEKTENRKEIENQLA